MLKLLNNIGIIGAILAAVADIAIVIIFVIGIKTEQDFTAIILFAIVNAVVGVLISILLRYQGIKYAEIENETLVTKFYKKKVKEKKYVSIGTWTTISALKDVFFKGTTCAFSIFGVVYISLEGSKNPVQILLTLVNLILFACFGLINMNSSYYRYYNIQVPYMENEIEQQQIKEYEEKITEIKEEEQKQWLL